MLATSTSLRACTRRASKLIPSYRAPATPSSSPTQTRSFITHHLRSRDATSAPNTAPLSRPTPASQGAQQERSASSVCKKGDKVAEKKDEGKVGRKMQDEPRLDPMMGTDHAWGWY